MTPSSAQATIQHLQALYPKANTTPTILQAFLVRLLRIDLDQKQALAVLDEQRMTSRRRSPSFPEILKALHDTAAQCRQASKPAGQPAASGPRRPTGFERELIDHVDQGTNPDLVTRLRKKIGAEPFAEYIRDIRTRLRAPR